MMRARSWLILLVLIAVGAGGYAWYRTRPREVAVATARTGKAVELVYATGYVEPRHPVTVAARITAPVRAVSVDEGDHVRKGEALVLLDDREERMLVEQAAAEHMRTALEEERALKLYGEGWVARSTRDAAVAAARGARAAEAAARARLDQMAVRAGLAAIVLKRDVQPGDLATPNTPLMQIGDPRDLWITATIDERDVPQLRIGQLALLKSDAWPERVIRGRLAVLTPGGDPTQRTFRARIVTAGVALPIGMSLEVNIVTREAGRAMLVPTNAVSDGVIWKVVDGRARRVAARVGIVGADASEILAGVQAGDRVILDPPKDLAESARVRPAKAAR